MWGETSKLGSEWQVKKVNRFRIESSKFGW